MLAIKALVLDDSSDRASFFLKLFEKWTVSCSVFKDVGNSLMHVNIFKPNIVLISTDLDMDYESTLNYLFSKNYYVVLYGENPCGKKWTKFPSFKGYLESPVSVAKLKKVFIDNFRKQFFHKIIISSHLEMIINDNIAVVEVGGLLTWDDVFQINADIHFEIRKKNITGILFIFQKVENDSRELIEELFPLLFGFLYKNVVSVEHVKYLSLDNKIDKIFSEMDMLCELEKNNSYAEAYLKLKSLVKGKHSNGLDIDFIREDSTLLENTYDKKGNLIKKAGEVFSRTDLENLKSSGVLKLYYPFELGKMGVDLNTAEGIQENIEKIIINQVFAPKGLFSSNELNNTLFKLPENSNSDKKILVIEDDEQINKLMEQIILKLNMKAFFALNGEEGLEKALKVDPDFIILDLIMPKMNGINFLKQYNSKAKEKTEIIVLSAVNKESVIQLAFKLGIKDYILKPFNVQSLKKIIKILC